MGNTHVKPHPRNRNKKQVHWKAADRPSVPGKPQLISETEVTPDLITIRWTKPISDGGSPIVGYLVEHRRTGSPHWVRATPLMVQLPELTISGLEPGWRYQFRVSAENAVGMSDPSELSEPITVTLQRSAITAPRFTQELQDTVALENEKSEFIVHFLGQPAPKVCWFKDGFEIFSSRRIRIITEHDKSILTIHQSALSDEGEIKCTATNRAGHISTKAKLTLEAPPSIRLPRQYEDGLLFEIGEMIRLKVSVAGRPTPLVHWTHNGESIKNNDRYEFEYNDKASILKVGEATRTDRGEYQIKAVNKLGEDMASFLVTVTDKPSPPGKARVVMTLGRSVTLSWNTPSDDGGCKIGNYIIEYYRLGWNVWLKAATSRQLSTILGDLIEGSEYKFRIKAESPYGVSDPSEESETVFIPDPKRGMLKPERGRSQPRDILSDTSTPIAAKRKKQRSQSSSRAEESNIRENIFNAGVPKRPDRNKIKSPPKTPDSSPMTKRKDIDISDLNKSFFDRSSMARDLAYGSPEIKVKKELDIPTKYLNNSSGSDRSKTNSPVASNRSDRSRSTSPINNHHSPVENNIKKVPRDSHDNFGGSSEFMLVLYPDENTKGHGSTSDIGFDFDDNSIPPPMSLSAPELSIEPPQLLFGLKQSASSTELLHERAMIRFYEAAQAEEMELERRRKANEARKQSAADIPKIQINSQDNQEIVGLERKHSLRRRLSAGGISQQQAMWAQRRQSLRGPNELNDLLQNKLQKYPNVVQNKRETMMLRQRSESEEKEEEEFKKVRSKMSVEGQSSFEKRTIKVVDEEKWNEEYEESLSEEDTESSSDDDDKRFKEKLAASISRYDSDEEEPYHPGMIGERLGNNNDPFEILTVRKNLPDPNFVPKPILKKTDYEEMVQDMIEEPPLPPPPTSKTKVRSHSPIPQSFGNRDRAQSLADPHGKTLSFLPKLDQVIDSGRRSPSPRPRSFSLIPQKELLEKQKQMQQDSIKQEQLVNMRMQSPPSLMHSIAAVAQISGITAASIVIPKKLLEKKKDAEEAKVVIEHYGDIVKNYGQRKKSTPQLYLDRDSLKQVAEETETSKIHQNNSVNFQPYDREEPKVPDRKNSFVMEAQAEPKRELSPKSTEVVQPAKPSFSQPDNKRPSPQREYSPTPNREYSPSPRDKKSYNQLKRSSKRTTTSVSPSRRSPNRTKRQSSKSPARPENWSSLKTNLEPKRRVSPSPARREILRQRSKSPSPIPLASRRPMLREIMTQTSVGLESFSSDSYSRTSTPVETTQRQEELMAKAEVKVRGIVDYTTDLVMFLLACWLYLFSNELFAIPVLFIMVYRQLKNEISKRIPKWILRRLKRNKK